MSDFHPCNAFKSGHASNANGRTKSSARTPRRPPDHRPGARRGAAAGDEALIQGQCRCAARNPPRGHLWLLSLPCRRHHRDVLGGYAAGRCGGGGQVAPVSGPPSGRRPGTGATAVATCAACQTAVQDPTVMPVPQPCRGSRTPSICRPDPAVVAGVREADRPGAAAGRGAPRADHRGARGQCDRDRPPARGPGAGRHLHRGDEARPPALERHRGRARDSDAGRRRCTGRHSGGRYRLVGTALVGTALVGPALVGTVLVGTALVGAALVGGAGSLSAASTAVYAGLGAPALSKSTGCCRRSRSPCPAPPTPSGWCTAGTARQARTTRP